MDLYGQIMTAFGVLLTFVNVYLMFRANKRATYKDNNSDVTEDANVKSDIKYIAKSVDDIKYGLRDATAHLGKHDVELAEVRIMAVDTKKRLDDHLCERRG